MHLRLPVKGEMEDRRRKSSSGDTQTVRRKGMHAAFQYKVELESAPIMAEARHLVVIGQSRALMNGDAISWTTRAVASYLRNSVSPAALRSILSSSEVGSGSESWIGALLTTHAYARLSERFTDDEPVELRRPTLTINGGILPK